MFVMAALSFLGFRCFFSFHFFLSLSIYSDCMQPNNALQRIFQYQWHNEHTLKINMHTTAESKSLSSRKQSTKIFRSLKEKKNGRSDARNIVGKWQHRSVGGCLEMSAHNPRLFDGSSRHLKWYAINFCWTVQKSVDVCDSMGLLSMLDTILCVI